MLKTLLTLGVFMILVLFGWAIHPVLGVFIAFIGYGVIDGLLTH